MAPQSKSHRKRSASVAPASMVVAALQDASPEKKSRIDPIFAGIVAILQGADDLNEHCRDMLVGMATPSLSKPKSERHDVQHLGVSMIEETLQAHKRTLIDAGEVARKELSELESSKSALLKCVDDTKALLEERKAAQAAAAAAHGQAKATYKAADKALAEVNGVHQKAEESHAALQKEKTGIESAYLEHFKEPMEASHGPHLNFLMPFIETLGFEESLISALPSCCVKTKEQRGGFDDLVLSELGKALVTKIAALEKGLVDEAAALSERNAAVASAKEAVEGEKLSEQTAAADLEAATAAQREAEAEVSKAEEAWTTFEPRMNEATANYNLHDSRRIDFEDGTLKSFETLRDKDTPMLVDGEAAIAGA